MLLKDGAAYLFGATITPLNAASTHVVADPTRTRKLLLNKRDRITWYNVCYTKLLRPGDHYHGRPQ